MAKAKKKPAPTPKVPLQGVTKAETARRMKVDTTTVRDYDRKGWVITYPDGSVDFDATVAAVKANKSTTLGGDRRPLMKAAGAHPSPMSLTAAKTRREIAMAEKAELEVARIRGDLIRVSDAEALYLDVVSRARAAIEAIPVRLMHRLVGLDAQAIRRVLTDEIAQALGGLDTPPPTSTGVSCDADECPEE